MVPLALGARTREFESHTPDQIHSGISSMEGRTVRGGEISRFESEIPDHNQGRNMDNFKKEMMKNVQIGGFKCPCCNDFFGKTRKVLNRLARKRLKNKLNNELKYGDIK